MVSTKAVPLSFASPSEMLFGCLSLYQLHPGLLWVAPWLYSGCLLGCSGCNGWLLGCSGWLLGCSGFSGCLLGFSRYSGWLFCCSGCSGCLVDRVGPRLLQLKLPWLLRQLEGLHLVLGVGHGLGLVQYEPPWLLGKLERLRPVLGLGLGLVQLEPVELLG